MIRGSGRFPRISQCDKSAPKPGALGFLTSSADGLQSVYLNQQL